CGSEGKRMLVASVPVAASKARTAICQTVEEASLLAAGGASIATVWSAMVFPVCLDDCHHIKGRREAPVGGQKLLYQKQVLLDQKWLPEARLAPRGFADHVGLTRQRHRGRKPDHQRLGGEDRGREIEAHFRAVEAADDGAGRRAKRTGAVA